MTDLVVAAPLRIEALAVGRGTRASSTRTRVVRTGAGQRATLTLNSAPEQEAVAVAGVCGALSPDLKPGDVVVATEVRGPHATVVCPSAPFLVAAIRAQGINAIAARSKRKALSAARCNSCRRRSRALLNYSAPITRSIACYWFRSRWSLPRCSRDFSTAHGLVCRLAR